MFDVDGMKTMISLPLPSRVPDPLIDVPAADVVEPLLEHAVAASVSVAAMATTPAMRLNRRCDLRFMFILLDEKTAVW
jgi:hypothetical protein